ncbi:peptide ABC transporter substrate-binding protein [Brevibacterium metallidurans]|uniref:ABC transporter substrate-binding protein n=1 Tax=Brevibacterium metallidurans TaxID=1482676 RepID=A0ABN0SJ52_9MICO
MTTTRHLLTLTALAASASLILSGCASGGTGSAPAGDGSLSFNTSEPKSILPQKEPGSQIGMALCANLMEMNVETQNYEPLVAESVESEDSTKWTITLKDGWTFQDGTPVTASSYVDAWNKTAYGPNAWQGNGSFTTFVGYEDLNPAEGEPKAKELSGVTTPDEKTIEVTLDAPNSDFPMLLSTNPLCPLPQAAFDDPDGYEKNPIGNGPYKFASWDNGVAVELEKWADFPGGQAFSGGADRLVAKIYTAKDAAYTDFTAGNLDMMRNTTPQIVEKAKNDVGEDAIYEVKTGSKQYSLQFPDYLEEYKDPDFRKAVSMSIDRQKIVDALLKGQGQPSDSLLPPSLEAYQQGACESCTFDPAQAKQLLEKSGFSGTLTISYASGGSDQVIQAVVRQIQDNLGIEVKLDPVLPTELSEKRTTGKLEGATYGLWGWTYKSPDQFLSQYQTGGDGNEVTQYSNPKVDDLLTRARGEQDPAKRNQLFADAEELILADLPAVPLFIPKDYGLRSQCAAMNEVQGDIQFYRAGYAC